MDVRAILLVTRPAEANGCAETLGGVPIALLPVLGRPVLRHVTERLRASGVSGVCVVSDPGDTPARFTRDAIGPDLPWTTACGNDFWRAAESAFLEQVASGAEVVILLRLGPYTEPDWEQTIQFHAGQRNRVTSLHDVAGDPLDGFLISASRRNEAAYLLRHRLRSFRTPCARLDYRGYLNRLRDSGDLRALACDAFAVKIAVYPAGRQWKPGVWVEEGARIDRGARILAPAFVGKRSRIRVAAVLTRGACVEHHCHVDFGTVIEDSTLLPYTAVGAGLDVAHSVAGFRRLAHLRRRVEVEISDPKLLSMKPTQPGLRALSSAAALAAFLPVEVFRGLFARSHREPPASLPEAIHAPSAALSEPTAFADGEMSDDPEKFPSNLVVTRRYGDQ